jgi:hypothetical protein
MKKEEIEVIKRRCEAATPGKWEIDDHRYDAKTGGKWERAGCFIEAIALEGYASGEWYLSEADAEFIAAARQDVPALVAEVEKLRGALIQSRERYR